jgi:hypothetical protein
MAKDSLIGAESANFARAVSLKPGPENGPGREKFDAARIQSRTSVASKGVRVGPAIFSRPPGPLAFLPLGIARLGSHARLGLWAQGVGAAADAICGAP